jgi:hypothetical protein
MSEAKESSVKCVRDGRKYPPASYRLPDDKKKWLSVCKERRAVALQLATYGDGDGTSIEAGVRRTRVCLNLWMPPADKTFGRRKQSTGHFALLSICVKSTI